MAGWINVVMTGGLGLGALLFCVGAVRARAAGRLGVSHFLELCGLVLCPVFLAGVFEQIGGGLGFWEESLDGKLIGGLVLVGMFLPVLLLVRYGGGRLVVVAGTLVWFAVLWGVVHFGFTLPTVGEIREADEIGLFRGTYFASSAVVVLRVWVWVVVAILGGFYAVRRRFSYGRLVMGTLVAGFGIVFLSCPFYVISLSWLVPVGCVVMALVLVWLPYQRGQFERLLGFRLSDGDPAPPWPGSGLAVGLSHFGLLVLAVMAGCSAILSYFELVQYKTVTEHRGPAWKSPAERNGFADLEALFINEEGVAAPAITAIDVPESFQQALRFHDAMSSATRAGIYEGLDRVEAEIYLGHIGEYLRGFEAASGADYLYIPGGYGMNYLNMRTTAYALAARSHLAMLDDRPGEAAADVETLLRMGGLMSDQPFLVNQMIGGAFRKCGVVAAWNLLGAGADNRALLEEVAGVLRACGDVGRVGLDYDALKLGEPWIMGPVVTVVPNMEMVVPAFNRAHRYALTVWSNFDLVEMGVALERFRLDRGGYPGELAELVPGYLERVPRDPIEGRAYFYERTAGGSYELKNLAMDGQWMKVHQPLFMPPMLAVDE